MTTPLLPTFDEALAASMKRSREIFELEFPDGKPTGANHGHTELGELVQSCSECWRLMLLFGEVFVEVRRG